ncbi:MAG: hypothetical protein NT076_05090 [Candidatus Pacearchaeota archaeon]|nr:hypothetical protein [Candidatus Pacearchaeota archaeon]
MKSELKDIENKIREQQEQIRIIDKQIKRQKWTNVYLLWSR